MWPQESIYGKHKDNKICLLRFSVLFSGTLFQRSQFLLSMGYNSTPKEMSRNSSLFLSAPENKKSGEQD